MSTPAEKTRDYVLGYSEMEAERLKMQAQIVGGWTDRFFRAAGLPGAKRILDVGCGQGDVSMLAADIAGPDATVLGIDRDAASIERARQRTTQMGYGDRVSFQQIDATELEVGNNAKFDAIVGRYILLYQRSAAASLGHLAKQLNSGGLMAFHELDFGATARMGIHPPLWDQSYTLLGEGFRRGGADPGFGLHLTRAFLDAGLGWPVIRAEIPVGGEPGSYLYRWLTDTLRVILPTIEKEGLATAEELQIDTLAARMEEECARLGCQLTGPTQYGAWVRLPG